MKKPVYTNRIETILEEKKEMNVSEINFFKEISKIKEEDLTEQQKKRINMIYVSL